MISKEFADASAEIIQILNYLPEQERKKVPLKLQEFFKVVSTKDYVIGFDLSKPLEEQGMKEKTRFLIIFIYRNYLCDSKEKEELDNALVENDKKYKKELSIKYDNNNLFKNKIDEYGKEKTEIIQPKKSSFFSMIIKKIKMLLHRA